MTRAPLDIIAENLPTYADMYIAPREIRIPSLVRLTKDAAHIMAALAAEGFEIVRRDDPGQGGLEP